MLAHQTEIVKVRFNWASLEPTLWPFGTLPMPSISEPIT